MESRAQTLRVVEARHAVPTLQEATAAFLMQCEAKGLSPATVHFYRQRLETFARRTGLTDLKALTPAERRRRVQPPADAWPFGPHHDAAVRGAGGE